MRGVRSIKVHYVITSSASAEYISMTVWIIEYFVFLSIISIAA